jgi:hypothetical protein
VGLQNKLHPLYSVAEESFRRSNFHKMLALLLLPEDSKFTKGSVGI